MSKWFDVLIGRFNKSGSDYRDVPTSCILRLIAMMAPNRWSFRISPVPITEYLIEPLHDRLLELGVDIRMGANIEELNPRRLDADYVVSAIPPLAYLSISPKGLYPHSLSRLRKIGEETKHQEISFRIFFDGHVLPLQTRCLDLHETAWGLLIMPASECYTERLWTSTVWSGTCTYARGRNSDGKTPTECTRHEFTRSIIEQIQSCRDLAEYFAERGHRLDDALDKVRRVGIWKGWQSDPLLSSKEYMSVNRYQETTERPPSGSRLAPRVFVCGAHCATSCEMWLMEGAAESGKKAAAAVLKQMGADPSTIKIHHHSNQLGYIALTTTAVVILLVLMRGYYY